MQMYLLIIITIIAVGMLFSYYNIYYKICIVSTRALVKKKINLIFYYLQLLFLNRYQMLIEVVNSSHGNALESLIF